MNDSGIWFNEKRGLWEVRLGTSRRRRIWLGRYPTIDEARTAKENYYKKKIISRPWPIGHARTENHV